MSAIQAGNSTNSTSDRKQNHKRFSQLDNKSIAHFSVFFDERQKGQGNFMIVYEDRIVQFGKSKGDAMNSVGKIAVDQEGGKGRILGSYHDPFTGHIYLYDQNSIIYRLDFRNFISQERFQIFMILESLKILGMFSWVQKQQSCLFIFHQQGVRVVSSTKGVQKSIEFPVLIWKVAVIDVQKKTKNFKEFCQHQTDSTVICALIMADNRFPLILTRFHILEMIINENADKIIHNSLVWREKNYVDQQQMFSDSKLIINRNTFTSMVVSNNYLIIGDSTGKINIFTYFYDEKIAPEVVVELEKTVVQGKTIQWLDLDHQDNVLAVSSNEAITLININLFKKVGKRLLQKSNKNLNVLKWSKMGKLFLADVSKERRGYLYLYLSGLPIQG